MSQDIKLIVSTLNKIRTELRALAPGDGDALIQIGAELESLASGQLPEEAAEVSDLFGLMLEGLQGIYQEQVPDFGRAVQSMSAALVAAEQALLSPSNPVCQEMLFQARRVLQLAISGEIETGNEKPLAVQIVSAEAVQLSLDDVAALLIQLEPEDRDDIRRVRENLKLIASDDTDPAFMLPAAARKHLVKAGRELGKILNRKSADPHESLSISGRLIEDALNAIAAAGESTQTVAAARTEPAAEIPVEAPAAEKNDEPAPIAKKPATASAATEKKTTYEPDVLPPDTDRNLLEDFITESSEYIEASEGALLQLEVDPNNLEDVNTVFRAFHTIKGTSAFLGLKRLSELAHLAESLLSRIRDREINCTGGYADLALRSVDALKAMLIDVRECLNGAPPRLPEGYADLMSVLTDPEAAGVSGEASGAQVAEMRIGDILVAQEKITREEVESVVKNQGEEPLGIALVKSSSVTAQEVAQALRTQQALANTTNERATESSVRVRTDRLDSLIDMVGELVIAQSMLAQDSTILSGEYHELTRKISHAGKIVRELQDLSMGMRMVPLKATFQKIARLVRDLAQKCGKQVEFVTEGEDTEIDRNMVDIISDPLVHMVRNAIDHGIETPDLREAKGKTRGGVVRLAAYHAGGNVVVELQDDGKGLDKDKILQKAHDKGLVEPDKTMSESEIFNLIFAPGFSTAEQVTDVSGRGVGMDVVRRNIEAMRGRVEIASEKGKGSTFTVRLPLTLAITDGMLVRVGTERFIVPTVNIHLSFNPSASSLSTVSGRGEMVLLRGELLPIIRLHRLFEVNNAVEQTTKGLLMIVADGRRRCALLVDELLGQQQVVAKSLGQGIGKIQGISGGAILGDGRVGLILDTAEIVALARQKTTPGNRKESALQNAA